MIRNNRYHPRGQDLEDSAKFDSTSTDSSESPRHIRQAPNSRLPPKEKLELCKKFIEYGYCPYRNKCKFAHGCHELRKNNQKNSLYKTKECVVFFKEGCCSYGDRCNFLHRKKNALTDEQLRTMKSNFGDFFAQLIQQSRVLKFIQ